MTDNMISLQVDGETTAVVVDTEATLLEILRENLELTGVRAGCREGGCGSCSVMLNGELVLACLVPAQRLQGAKVETVEGMSVGFENLHPLQQAFIDNGATQCGFCTSGMITAAKTLLAENPEPSRDEVITAIAGNVCRCTGYGTIVDAILDAANRMR